MSRSSPIELSAARDADGHKAGGRDGRRASDRAPQNSFLLSSNSVTGPSFTSATAMFGEIARWRP